MADKYRQDGEYRWLTKSECLPGLQHKFFRVTVNNVPIMRCDHCNEETEQLPPRGGTSLPLDSDNDPPAISTTSHDIDDLPVELL